MVPRHLLVIVPELESAAPNLISGCRPEVAVPWTGKDRLTSTSSYGILGGKGYSLAEEYE